MMETRHIDMYLHRTIEKHIEKIKGQFAVITIYGARQVGKSTMADSLFGQEMASVSLDDYSLRALANENPALFLENYGWPLLIDEIQKAPVLLSEIKSIVDKEKLKCLSEGKKVPLMYVLTGSNQFELQQAISESMAGRTAILMMSSLSNNEIEKAEGSLFDPHVEALREKYKLVEKKGLYRSRKEIFKRIYEGGMPEYVLNGIDRETFFKSYITTYLERDVKKVISVGKERDFLRFLNIMALRTGQQINYDDISRNVGVDARTVKSWISVLLSSGIAITLEPYARSFSDRVTKMEKFYFLDTGLCSYLCKWPDAETLENGIMSGAFYETYAISEIVKSYMNAGKDFRSNFYYYRDKDKKEVDLIIDFPDHICPISVNKGIVPAKNNFNFNFLKKYGKRVERGLVIDSREDIFPINSDNWYCPIFMIGI